MKKGEEGDVPKCLPLREDEVALGLGESPVRSISVVAP
jgi:hypothetical protein